MATSAVDVTATQDLDVLTLQGVRLFREKAWQEALDCFNVVAIARPDDAEIHNYCARALETGLTPRSRSWSMLHCDDATPMTRTSSLPRLVSA